MSRLANGAVKTVKDMSDGLRNGIDWIGEVTPPWLVVIYACVIVVIIATH